MKKAKWSAKEQQAALDRARRFGQVVVLGLVDATQIPKLYGPEQAREVLHNLQSHAYLRDGTTLDAPSVRKAVRTGRPETHP